MNKKLKYIVITVFVMTALGIGFVATRQKSASPDGYIGLTESQAIDWATNNGLEYRVTRRDTESLPITDDFRNDRVNFELDNGKVTKASRF